jgi:hypothetical protein
VHESQVLGYPGDRIFIIVPNICVLRMKHAVTLLAPRRLRWLLDFLEDQWTHDLRYEAVTLGNSLPAAGNCTNISVVQHTTESNKVQSPGNTYRTRTGIADSNISIVAPFHVLRLDGQQTLCPIHVLTVVINHTCFQNFPMFNALVVKWHINHAGLVFVSKSMLSRYLLPYTRM